jgi:hypothetical protein
MSDMLAVEPPRATLSNSVGAPMAAIFLPRPLINMLRS